MDTGRACVSTLGTTMPARWVAAVELLCLAALGAHGYLRHLSLAGVEPLASTTRAVRARELLMAAAGLDVLVAVGNRVGLTPGTFQLARLLRPAVAVLSVKTLRTAASAVVGRAGAAPSTSGWELVNCSARPGVPRFACRSQLQP